MTPTKALFLDAMKQAAERAAAEEEGFRRDWAARVAVLERERAHAFRRLNLMRSLSEAAGATEKEAAVASTLAVFREKLGWTGDSEARTATLDRFRPVVEALVGALRTTDGEAAPDVPAALAEFETWYALAHGSAFWVLFDHYMPETPRVDF
ncbi:MAG TPA: hypothetical protein VK433_06450 [Stellaceae bacterium]|nr:hypothetical protein [Stellaceae bacterium]